MATSPPPLPASVGPVYFDGTTPRSTQDWTGACASSSSVMVTVLCASGPLVRGTLKVFPNPARRSNVSFTYRITEPAAVEIRIFDTSGHQVTTLTGPGTYGVENRLVWDPGRLPAGLYMARVQIKGASGERTEVLPLGILK